VNIRANGISVDGHARYAPEGQDIVCASVSTLFQVLIQAIEDLTGDNIEYAIASGKAYVKWEHLSEISRVLVDAFLVGIRMIVDGYPEYVRFKHITEEK